jgi:predicted nucleic acid-binding protein
LNRQFVLDANALLDFSDDGPGAAQVEQLISDALDSRTPLLMSVVNWGEVVYQLWQQRGEEAAHRIVANLSHLPIQLIDVDLTQCLKAAEIKARNKIPYVDCLAAALALVHGATIVTSDRDFEKLGRQAKILWIKRH